MITVVITGGGTGGHVVPMTAVSDALGAAGIDASEIRLVVSRRGPDRQLLAGRAEGTLALPGRGIRRSFAPRDLGSNLLAALSLTAALAAAVVAVGAWRPRVVVSLGGYAALAGDLAAVLWRVPLVLVDVDTVPSAAHKVVGRFAAARCSGLAPSAPGATVTGVPLRPAIESADRGAARVNGAPARRWSVVAMTGSLGARSVNDAVAGLAERWRGRDDVRLTQVTGSRDESRVRAAFHHLDADALEYEVVPFAEMAPLWASCDLAICRAGAMTCAELTHLGVAAILVPLPGSPDDHQRKNAEAVASTGGAIVVEDTTVSAALLDEVASGLLASPERLVAMSSAARSMRHEGAAAAIAEVVLGAKR
jgi:UDP-N-acetylglucosamine--N-acetylmuramyl-(pentapeptide) pyrophosphoryl-undecaprenol N-acetylglucosamine transferase